MLLVNDLVRQFFELFINVSALNVYTSQAFDIFIDIFSFLIAGVFITIIAMIPFMVYRGVIRKGKY